MAKWGYLLLAVWLIATGLISILHIHLGQATIVIPVLALVAGVLIFLDAIKVKLSNIGGLLLGIWLVVSGLAAFVHIAKLGILLAIIAIAAGILLLLKK
jgi:hypothetical protein